MTLRGCRLLPICIQALYNMTTVEKEYDKMDRITKLFLTLPAVGTFDYVPFVIKALVNCSRFHSLRPRIVEDGTQIIRLFYL